MKVSTLWLNKFFDAPLPSAEELSNALMFHAFEIDAVEKVGEDTVLDVKITPNRGHDCLSHRGIAMELSAILNTPLTHDPLKDTPVLEPKTSEIEVSVETPELCSRYIAALIKGVKVGPSPQWLKERLEAVGQRSINNVVDATNFVMWNLGQPLHAFDAKKLSNKKAKYLIGVRRARVDERMTALDGKEYALTHENLVIADNDLNVPIGIAGVKGGLPAAITEETRDIILESATFDGPTVRKSASRVGLRSDASSRFEQGISPELAAYGMHSVVELIKKLAGGELAGFAEKYRAPEPQRSVSVSVSKIEEILGTKVGESTVEQVFNRLGFSYTKNQGQFVVTPPWVRLDILIAEDLVEEVVRIVGYDGVVPKELPPMHEKPRVNENFYWAEHTREVLMSAGYSEILTSVFAEKGERTVLNKVDGVKPYLRSTLLDNLKEALERNTRNKELLGVSEVKLFEIGTVWKGDEEVVMVGQVSEKEPAKEVPLKSLEKSLDEWTHYESLPLSSAVKYQGFSKYPYIVRDIALWVPANTNPEDVRSSIAGEAGALCVRVDLFDTFKKEERLSLAFRLVFQSFDKTLTEAEANQAMEKVAAALRAKGFEIR